MKPKWSVNHLNVTKTWRIRAEGVLGVCWCCPKSFVSSLGRGSSSQNKQKKSLIKQWSIKLNPCLSISPLHSQRRLGGQVRRDRRLPEGGGRRNHDKAEVGLRDLVRSLLPEADTRLQCEEPLVPRILAASLPVQAEGTPAGEQRLQPHLHLLVPPMGRPTQPQAEMGCC